MDAIDILQQPNARRVRKEINNICDSYSHPWDIIAELCQNAVDAINLFERKFPDSKKSHEILIIIDSRSRSISVRDTGIGINPDDLPSLLQPHSTNKDSDDKSIGEKGVGLTYTMFACDDYFIETHSIYGETSGRLSNGSSWRHSLGDSEPPKFERISNIIAERKPSDTFTIVKASGIESSSDDYFDLFKLEFKQVEFVLRSKTAIGFTKKVLNDKAADSGYTDNISVILEKIDTSGKVKRDNIQFSHVTPADFVSRNDVIDIEEFKKVSWNYTDTEKRRKLRNKLLIKKHYVVNGNRKISYYASYVSSKNFWSDTSKDNELQLSPTLSEEPPINMLDGGIYIATKGMPTGILLSPPNVGLGTYFGNMFIVLEDDKIDFDIGRKHVHSGIQKTLKGICRDIFLEFRPFFKLMSTTPENISREEKTMERDKVFSDIEKLPKLQIPRINIVRHPDSQEAAVVAIFHELVGAGHLPGYFTYRIGYKDRYDFWGEFQIDANFVDPKWRHLSTDGVIRKKIIAEFKYSAESLVDDLLSEVKKFSDIDLLVCWDLDEVKLKNKDVTVEYLADTDSVLTGVNYRLVFPGHYGSDGEIPVIGLRRICEALSIN